MNKKVINGIAVVIVLGGLLISTCQRKMKKDKLKNCKNNIVVGYITGTRWQGAMSRSPGLYVDYAFEVDGKVFNENQKICYDCESFLKDEIDQKHFPVLYCEDNPEFSYALILPRAYSYFHLDFPDSLLWVKKYLLEAELDSSKFDDIYVY